MQNQVISRQGQATTIILLFLLIIRFVDGLRPQGFWTDNVVPFAYAHATIVFALLALVIFLNKSDLANLNIDRTFISFYIFSATLLSVWLGLSVLGSISLGIAFSEWIWLALFGTITSLSTVFVVFLRRTKKLTFKINQSLPSLLAGSLLGIMPVLIFRFLCTTTGLTNFSQGFLASIKTVEILWNIVFILWGIVYEEMLFRGMIWAFLRERNCGNVKILIIQALLFWLCHLNLVSTISFWFALPLISLWLGFLVLRYKSLIPSAMTHLVYNFLAVIMRAAL